MLGWVSVLAENLIRNLLTYDMTGSQTRVSDSHDFLPSLVKTHQQIAEEYGISVRTLRRWIRKAELNIPSGLINPYYQLMIYQTFGPPRHPKNK